MYPPLDLKLIFPSQHSPLSCAPYGEVEKHSFPDYLHSRGREALQGPCRKCIKLPVYQSQQNTFTSLQASFNVHCVYYSLVVTFWLHWAVGFFYTHRMDISTSVQWNWHAHMIWFSHFWAEAFNCLNNELEYWGVSWEQPFTVSSACKRTLC